MGLDFTVWCVLFTDSPPLILEKYLSFCSVSGTWKSRRCPWYDSVEPGGDFHAGGGPKESRF
jgi:hypothetical protein